MLTRSRLCLTAACVAALVGGAVSLRAADPTSRPARDKAAVESDIQTDMKALQGQMPGEQFFTDAAARVSAAPKLTPALRKVYADFDELAATDANAKVQVRQIQGQLNQMLALLGDADATGRLQAMADSKDAAESVDGKGQQLLVKWWQSAADAGAQGKVADDAERLAKANPQSVPLTMCLFTMSQTGSATPELKSRVQGLVTGTMKNAMASQVSAQVDGEQKLAALAGKPMVIAGKTVDGKDFTTADWKGKVVLVDFWATWCPPCRAELPRVEKIYADNHPKGLEILGVSNDRAADDLTKFVAKDGKMPWPQLFDAGAAGSGGWNPITTNFGINGIPTMFLIDKKGICRTVEARESMEDLIPKLLAE